MPRPRTNRIDVPVADCTVVESPQSVANWLEAMTWEPPQLGRMSSPTAKLAQPLAGMPYVQVNNPDGTPLNSNEGRPPGGGTALVGLLGWRGQAGITLRATVADPSSCSLTDPSW